VGKVGRDARGIDDIVEGELVNQWADFHEERQWLVIKIMSFCTIY